VLVPTFLAPDGKVGLVEGVAADTLVKAIDVRGLDPVPFFWTRVLPDQVLEEYS